jgi:Leucine-rich repeat (LRR) protein
VTLWFSTTETEYEWHVPAEYAQKREDGNHRLRRLASSNGTGMWTKHENWLSEKGICGWEGIQCINDEDGTIVIDGDLDGDVSQISLGNNNLHGLMCKEIYTTLPHLSHADLSSNGFTGILSSEIGLWKKLTYLNFTANRIGGTLPREVGEISQLKVLHFADNLLGGTIPHTIGDLSKMRDLDLSGNELKGTIPYSLGQLEELISLHLGELIHTVSVLGFGCRR